jgi:transcription antitermination factor NusB
VKEDMGKRRRAREEALKIMYQYEMRGEDESGVINRYWSHNDVPDDVKLFATELVEGTLQHIKDIDLEIKKYSKNWSLERIGTVERSILRLAIYELLYRDDIPPKVAINEAIEIEKKFGSDESAPFVNGILDKIKTDKELKD